jgi:molybdopterin converting factor subunit 1
MHSSATQPAAPETRPQITVTARFFALYREAAGQDHLAVTVPEGTTVGGLWQYLLEAAPGLAAAGAATAYTAYAVNGGWAKSSRALAGGDEVAFLPPVSGG